jgi:outer membrane protein OmpA-like peptidoglycan-associated protein
MKLLAAFCLLLAAVPAGAQERWILSAEAPAAVPLSAAQRDRFGVGGMPALALYRSLSPWILLGGRIRAGLLSDGNAPPTGTKDPGAGGFGSASVALRLRLPDAYSRGTGPWVEVVGGGGITGKEVRFAWEAGLGWGFRAGPVDVGPSIRVLRVEDPGGPMSLGTATILLAGVEFAFGDGLRAPVIVAEAAPPPPAPSPPPTRLPEPEPEAAVETNPDQDGDGIPDARDACPREPETVNGIEDEDGCPDAGPFVVKNDRIVLEEVVLFEVNRARVKRGGKDVLRDIAALWHKHPEWSRMVVEGHADVRGTDRFNDWLSQTRAERVKAAVGELGFSLQRVEAVGYGAHKPRDPGRTKEAHRRNRRVEFVIVREHARTQAEVK